MRSKEDTAEREIKKLTVHVNIDSDHIQGSVNAPLNIVEYGDYECPYTGMAYPIVKDITRRFGDKIYFVFRNFPLNDIHPHAQNAAEAAEAVAAQDKFWEMHDYLFEHQKALDDGHLLKYAQKVERFKKDISGHVYSSLIDESLKTGIIHFYINGVRYEDSWDLGTFSETLKRHLTTQI
jgi:hypothetical protein